MAAEITFLRYVQKACILGLLVVAGAFISELRYQEGFNDGEANIRRIMKDNEETQRNFLQKYPITPHSQATTRPTQPSNLESIKIDNFYSAERER